MKGRWFVCRSAPWSERDGNQSPIATNLTIFIYITAFTMFTNVTTWCYTKFMRRATITLPDDLAEATESYLRTQEVPPALTTVVQTALREYLRERGFLRVRRTLKIRPARRGSGRSDVSQNHDLYFTGLKK
jgi:hypothetical protein